MPKKSNVAKASSAQYQNIIALAEAAAGTPGKVYLCVEKALGNRYFLCVLAGGQKVQAEPRKLFTKGTMRISVGSIVVGEQPQTRGGIYEIVGVIQERSEARRLVKAGVLSKAILDRATSAEESTSAQATAMGGGDDALARAVRDAFMTPEEADEATAREAAAAALQNAGSLYSIRGEAKAMPQQAKVSIFAGSGIEVKDPSKYAESSDDGHHASRGLKQARMAEEAKVKIQQRLSALIKGVRIATPSIMLERDGDGEGEGEDEGQKRYRARRTTPSPTLAPIPEEDPLIAEVMGFLAKATEVVKFVEESGEEERAVNASRLAAKVEAVRRELAALEAFDDWEAAEAALGGEISLESL
jgi:hypothetical protein